MKKNILLLSLFSVFAYAENEHTVFPQTKFYAGSPVYGIQPVLVNQNDIPFLMPENSTILRFVQNPAQNIIPEKQKNKNDRNAGISEVVQVYDVLKEQLKLHHDSFEMVQTQLNSHEVSQEQSQERLADHDVRITQVQQKQVYTEGAMLKIEQDLEKHSKAFQVSSGKDEQHEESLKTLAILTDSLKANHLANLTRIYDGQEDVANVKAALEETDKRSEDNSKKSAKNTADITAVNGKLATVETRSKNNLNKLTANKKDIAEHRKYIDSITTQQKTNTRHILENREHLQSLANDLRETNERVDHGLAASAALNGLFQPYGIGKFNFSAAAGGYNSTQAVALGTGYRFNENIAVKSGVSYTGSNDVMYNMAVNLEW